MSSRLSVVVLSQNNRHNLPIFLLQLLKHIEEAGLEEVKITVIDNSSDDGSDLIVEAMSKTFRSLSLIRFENPLSESDLLVRSLSEVSGDYLALFLTPGVSPGKIDSYIYEVGGDQFAVFRGSVFGFSLSDPNLLLRGFFWWLIDLITPNNTLPLRSYGFLLHKELAEQVAKEMAVGDQSISGLARALLRNKGVAKVHDILGAPLVAFLKPWWKFLWGALKIRVLSLAVRRKS